MCALLFLPSLPPSLSPDSYPQPLGGGEGPSSQRAGRQAGHFDREENHIGKWERGLVVASALAEQVGPFTA